MITQKSGTYLFAAIFIFTMFAAPANSGEDDFAKKLYEPVHLTPRVVLPPAPHPNLSEQDKRIVLEARNTLVRFLKSFRNEKEEPLSYLGSGLRKQFSDTEQLYRALGGGMETHFVKLQVDDFAYRKSAQEIIFYLDFTTTGYGEDHTRPLAFALQQSNGEWKLSRFGNAIREREFEEQRK